MPNTTERDLGQTMQGFFQASELLEQRARICVDYSSQESMKLVERLREVGFKVETMPIHGLKEPKLNFDSYSFYGFVEIQGLLHSLSACEM